MPYVHIPGTAVATDVLIGKKFSAGSSFGATGSMPDNGNWNATPGPNAITIPAGYHNGAGQVTAVAFDAAKLLTGTTIAGTAGTMPNQGAKTWTPGKEDQAVPSGYYRASTVRGEANLVAANIRSGVTLFGVAGNVQPKIQASGSATVYTQSGAATSLSNNVFSVDGLGFKPNVVLFQLPGNTYFAGYADHYSTMHYLFTGSQYATQYALTHNQETNPLLSNHPANVGAYIYNGGFRFSAFTVAAGNIINWWAFKY